MQAFKETLLAMVEQSQFSENRIKVLESALRSSKQHLEAVLNEKEGLMKKIEMVEMQIINADRQRGEIVDKLKTLEIQIDRSELHRRVLEEKEVESDNIITKMENKLRSAQTKYQENSLRLNEAKQRLDELSSEYCNLLKTRAYYEEKSTDLKKEVFKSTSKMICLERANEEFSKKESSSEDQIKYLEDNYRQMNEKQEANMLNALRLQRLIDSTKDKIESLQIQTKSKEMELRNAVYAGKKD